MLIEVALIIIKWVIVFRIIWKFDEMTNERIDNLQWSIDILLNRIEESENRTEELEKRDIDSTLEELEEEHKRDN